MDGGLPAAGKLVRIEVAVWVFDPANDFLDLFYTSNAATGSPTWTFLTTLTPSGTGARTLSTTYVLSAGGVQAARALPLSGQRRHVHGRHRPLRRSRRSDLCRAVGRVVHRCHPCVTLPVHAGHARRSIE
ncbi:MAG: hypothetical protein A3H95_05175 [Acidobacteria bacterium RIFCSPLOWO2_02_FULL_64_15]|nr:MAG: hypothetical protein A3H95_05175 [Acidobacteria bacterium RIFCSPLOWO2_02_FULL_64_15]